MFAIMTTWWRGRHELSKTMETGTIPDEMFLADIATTQLPRVIGTAVFMSSGTDGMPNVLLHHVKHNKVLHKQVVLLSVITENVPFARATSRCRSPAAHTERWQAVDGFYRVLARVGFMQQPNVPKILARCEKHGLHRQRRRYDVLPRAPDAAHHRRRRGRALAQAAVLVPVT